MALLSSLFTAVSGMQNQQTLLNVISNNIANVGTIGFKAGRVQFNDLLSQTLMNASGPNSTTNQGGINPIQQGAGVTVASIDTVQTQGTFQATGNATDLAVNGDGYFITKSGTQTLYTRAGSFRFDSSGNLVDPSGDFAQGWMAQTPATNPLSPLTIDSSDPTKIGAISIKSGMTLAALQTSNVKMVGNLDAGATASNLSNVPAGTSDTTQITVFDYTPGAPPVENSHTYTVGQHKMTFSVYDSLGNAHSLTATLTNLSGTQIPEAQAGQLYDNNTWSWTVDTDANDKTVHLALDNSTYVDPTTNQTVRASSSGLLHFNNNGSLDWVGYADRNAEHFGTNFTQLTANDPNIPGGNSLPATPLAAPLPVAPDEANPADVWADIADQDPHNSTMIGFEGATVPAGDFQGAADQSVQPFGVPAGPPPSNEPWDNPGVPELQWNNATGQVIGQLPAMDSFALSKLPIVLCYQNVPAGSPLPPQNTTAGTLVTMDVGGMNESTGLNLPTSANTGLQQWYVQSINVNWGTVSTITQADFDRNQDLTTAGGALNVVNENGAVVPNSTGDGIADGAHTDASAGAAVSGGTGAGFGDRADTLEMPWDPRVVRSSLGGRDGLTQDTTGSIDPGTGLYKPSFTARIDSVDGYAEGTLSSVQVSSDGTVVGSFTNGKTIGLARLAFARFQNPAGLAKIGNTNFVPTVNSGDAVVGTAGTDGRGAVVGGVLEQSNVDLTSELTNMIVAQRGFEVNARLISVSDTILNDLVNLGK